jgi:hypothetical protein
VAAFTTIQVDDKESTPVTHDFEPKFIDGVIARFVEKSASSSLGFMPLSISIREPNRQTQKDLHYTVRIQWAMPVTVDETINGVTVTKVDHVNYSDQTLKISASATEQERQNFAEMDANLRDQAGYRAVVEDLEYFT